MLNFLGNWRRVRKKQPAEGAACTIPGPNDRGNVQTSVFVRARLAFVGTGARDAEGRKIRWGLSIGFRVRADGTRLVRIEGYLLDDVSASGLGIRLVGDHSETLFPCNSPRPDALAAHKIPAEHHAVLSRCGIACDVEVNEARVRVVAVLHDQELDLGVAEFIPQVLCGHEGWLFLTGDTNDSPGQYSRDFVAEQAWIEGWETYFAAYRQLDKTGLVRFRSFVIAPSKEEVFPDLYPLPRAKHRLIDAFLAKFGNEPSLTWPEKLLRDQRELSFDRGETHWTDFGARLVCEDLMKTWGHKLPNIPMNFGLRQGAGDLGDKVMPRLLAHRATACWHNRSELIFNNYVLHHGNIRVWKNPEPTINETVMICGGSSADYMVRYFSAVFARVVFVYSACASDPSLLELEKPERLILQTSQRFLTQPMPPEVDARAVAARKVAAGQLTCKGDYAEAMAAWTDESVSGLVA